MVVKAGHTYTKAIFEAFQIQYEKSLEYNLVGCTQDGDEIVYKVSLDGHAKERFVRVMKDNTISCSCRLFESEGILCRHAVKILTNYMNVKEIPDQYVMKRWTRKARSETVKDMLGHDIRVDTNQLQTSWYKSLSSVCTRISSRAAESEDTYKYVVHQLTELNKTVEEMLCSKVETPLSEDGRITPSSIVNNTIVACHSKKVKLTQAKGFKKKEGVRGRKRRIIGEFEKNMSKNLTGNVFNKKKSCNSSSIQPKTLALGTSAPETAASPIPMIWMPCQQP